MALQVGRFSAFERRYMQKFRQLAAEYGEFVQYENDRGARDIGLHFTRKMKGGNEIVSSTLCWFQMKGITESSLSKPAFDELDRISIDLEVNHLRFWYIQPMATYLVVYVEAADDFFVVNMKKYVEENFGNSILELAQKTKRVSFPKNNKLDDHAFRLIMNAGDIDVWKNFLGGNREHARILSRDMEIIKRFGTSEARGVRQRIRLVSWITKTRSEVEFYEENPAYNSSFMYRRHWQFMMGDPKMVFPYLSFAPLDSDDEEDLWWDDEDDVCSECGPIDCGDGVVIRGTEAGGEYCEYQMTGTLNPIGSRLFEVIAIMEKAGFLEVEFEGETFLSVAPWHARDL